MSDAIHTDTLLPLPPEKARRALTDSKSLAPWLMPIDFEHRVGHHFMFHTDPVPAQGFDGIVHCEVPEHVPCRRLSISWRGALSTRRSPGSCSRSALYHRWRGLSMVCSVTP